MTIWFSSKVYLWPLLPKYIQNLFTTCHHLGHSSVPSHHYISPDFCNSFPFLVLLSFIRLVAQQPEWLCVSPSQRASLLWSGPSSGCEVTKRESQGPHSDPCGCLWSGPHHLPTSPLTALFFSGLSAGLSLPTDHFIVCSLPLKCKFHEIIVHEILFRISPSRTV